MPCCCQKCLDHAHMSLWNTSSRPLCTRLSFDLQQNHGNGEVRGGPTTRLLPSLRPHVCRAKPPDVRPTLAARPMGTHSGCRAAIRKPVRQQAADSPKQAPACRPNTYAVVRAGVGAAPRARRRCRRASRSAEPAPADQAAEVCTTASSSCNSCATDQVHMHAEWCICMPRAMPYPGRPPAR
jgi:hypothetical protein